MTKLSWPLSSRPNHPIRIVMFSWLRWIDSGRWDRLEDVLGTHKRSSYGFSGCWGDHTSQLNFHPSLYHSCQARQYGHHPPILTKHLWRNRKDLPIVRNQPTTSLDPLSVNSTQFAGELDTIPTLAVVNRQNRGLDNHVRTLLWRPPPEPQQRPDPDTPRCCRIGTRSRSGWSAVRLPAQRVGSVQ